MWRLRTLASQIMIAISVILIATVLIGGLFDIRLTRSALDEQYKERAESIAKLVAGLPQIQTALQTQDRSGTVQTLASNTARSAGAAYVVVSDRDGIRYSHPNPALIGLKLEEPVAVLDGRSHVGIDHGSLGRSANGKAPVFDANGRVIGQVSVGILETEVAAEVNRDIAAIAGYSAIALAIGVLVAFLLQRALKRLTFGLELRDIATLLQEREAMLHGISEGVIGFDVRGRVSIVNDEARRLLEISGPGLGARLDELVPAGRLYDVLNGSVAGSDQTLLTPDAVLLINRRPVVLGGRDVGSVVTVRDRTELEALIRRMNAVTGLTSALRAQEHEFTNRLHVLAGLIDLGEVAEARGYLDSIVAEQFSSAESLRARISPPAIAALLVAKVAVAAERGIELTITNDSLLDADPSDQLTLVSVLGNLIDNAIEATAEGPEARGVTVRMRHADELRIVVTDTGPGVSAADLDQIFVDGFSTKPARGEQRRGVGLALVQRLVARAGGRIEVRPGPGGHFEVVIPHRRRSMTAADASRTETTSGIRS